RAVTVGGERPAVEDPCGGLVYNRNIGLIDLGRRGRVKHSRSGLIDVAALITTVGVASEVISLYDPGLERGMIRIDSSIDDSDLDPGAGEAIGGPHLRKMNDLSRGLDGVSLPDRRSVVINHSFVG